MGQFIGVQTANNKFIKNAYNRANGAPPVVGSMTTLGAGTFTAGGIFSQGIEWWKEFLGVGKPSDPVQGDDASFKTIPFQFFPEDITDSRRQQISEKDILLASDVVPTLGSAGRRQIGFTCIFAQERIENTMDFSTTKSTVPLDQENASQWDKYSFDVAIAMQVMRSFAYPLKVPIAGGISVLIQPILLHLPGTLIGLTGDTVIGAISGYDATMKAFFPNGRPRLGEVKIEFVEYPTINPQTPRGYFKQDFAGVVSTYREASDKVINRNSPQGPRTAKINWEVPVKP